VADSDIQCNEILPLAIRNEGNTFVAECVRECLSTNNFRIAADSPGTAGGIKLARK
jgi:hypothetical protein